MIYSFLVRNVRVFMNLRYLPTRGEMGQSEIIAKAELYRQPTIRLPATVEIHGIWNRRLEAQSIIDYPDPWGFPGC